jgi:hypothetical protein
MKVIDLFGDLLKQRRELNELTAYAADPGELERVARDLNVMPADLEMLVRQVRKARTNCRTRSRHWVSTKRPHGAPSRPCCATWSASVRSARTSAGVITSAWLALLRRTIWSIVKTRIRWTR